MLCEGLLNENTSCDAFNSPMNQSNEHFIYAARACASGLIIVTRMDQYMCMSNVCDCCY